MKTAKYDYYKVIQQNWGNGWDDVDFHPCSSQGVQTKENRESLKENLKAYRENQPQAPARVIFRKELRSITSNH